jgi:ATP-dependent Lhr-like helicase
MPQFPKPRPLPRRASSQRVATGAALPDAPGLGLPLQQSDVLPVRSRNAAGWMRARGWKPFPFQRQVWRAIAEGRSGLLHASTGAGKTHAVWLGALQRALTEPAWGAGGPQPLTVLWVTPMRALAADTVRALGEPLAALGLRWQVGLRTGDTSSAERQRQSRRLPPALVTTPESLSLMLTRPQSSRELAGLRLVVVDEWHELLASKRGVQLQLALARLRRLNPALIVWGLSATLGDPVRALQVLCPGDPNALLLRADVGKRPRLDTLIPDESERFPWAGHLGMRMRDAVVREIDASASTLLFTNTRAQSELWYGALLDARPDWAGLIAVHHGSLDRQLRDWVESGLKHGRLRAVVCTSSLDLGVDFSPVERVLQIGSAKGVARLLQRAGRSGHGPGRQPRVTLVPTHALELVEAAAAGDAIAAGAIESRDTPRKPLDVLVQHLVTIALGSGFEPADMLAELRSCEAYRDLEDDEFGWALDFIGRGGASLANYPEYRRVVIDAQGVFRVADAGIARRHRMAIGTIVADSSMQVRFLTGGVIGSVEEGFIARLRPGDRFLFAGRALELVRVREMTAWVRRAAGSEGAVPRWNGGRMPLSSEMAQAVLARLERAAVGEFSGPAMRRAQALLELQARWSALPTESVLLAETLQSREGHHLFLYPFAGRNVHLGLGSLLAWRLAQAHPATFSIAVNDYGLELLSPTPLQLQGLRDASLFSEENLLEHVLASLNSGELAQRRFREIARIAGLVFQGFPGAARSNRQLQASSGLFFEVFRKHDPGNLLLAQSQREVLETELELDRLRASLRAMRGRELCQVAIARPTPFAFPLMVERLRERLSTEKLSDRIGRMIDELERAADTATRRKPDKTNPRRQS